METVWQFVAGAILAWQARDTKKLLERMDQRHRASHEGSQGMLKQMDARHAQGQRETRELIERLDPKLATTSWLLRTFGDSE
jgi:hypothetical protein